MRHFHKILGYVGNDFRRIPFGVKLIVLVLFLRTLGWGFVDPYYSLFLDRFSDQYSVVGLLVSLMAFASLLTIIPLLRLADKVKDTRIIEDGEIFYFFAIIFYVAAGYLNSIPLLIFALIFNGIGHPLVYVGAETYVRKTTLRGGSSKAFAYYTALEYGGWILSMFLSGFLIQYYNFNLMFLAVMPSIFLSFLILPRIRERGYGSFFAGFRHYFHRKEDFVDIINGIKELDSKSFFFLVLSFFDGVIRVFSLYFIPLYALKIHLSLSEIAWLMSFMYFPYVLSFLLSEVMDKMRKMDRIAFSLFAGAAAFLGLTFVSEDRLGVALLFASISLSIAILRPAYNGMLTRITPRRVLGEVTGINNLISRLGMIIGPLFIGYISDLYNLQLVFIIIGIVALFLALLSLLFRGYETLVQEL